jgi:Ca2+-binding EF-hand superfamily protein
VTGVQTCALPIFSTDEFTAWIKSEGGAMVDQQALDMIIIFQSMDSDQDGAISRIEFMCFLLQHSADVESLVKWIDSKCRL